MLLFTRLFLHSLIQHSDAVVCFGILVQGRYDYIIPGIPPPIPPIGGIAGASSAGASVTPASVVRSIAEAVD